jgi:hypothetical protein
MFGGILKLLDLMNSSVIIGSWRMLQCAAHPAFVMQTVHRLIQICALMMHKMLARLVRRL